MSFIRFMGRSILPPVGVEEDEWILSLSLNEAVDVLLKDPSYPLSVLDGESLQQQLSCTVKDDKTLARKCLTTTSECLDSTSKDIGNCRQHLLQNGSELLEQESPVPNLVVIPERITSQMLSKPQEVNNDAYEYQLKLQQQEQPKQLLQHKQKLHLKQQHLQLQQQSSDFITKAYPTNDVSSTDINRTECDPLNEFHSTQSHNTAHDTDKEIPAMTSNKSGTTATAYTHCPQHQHRHLDDYLLHLTGQPLHSGIPAHHPISQSWSPAVTASDTFNDAPLNDVPEPKLSWRQSPPPSPWPGDLSPCTEELPKWLREARTIKNKVAANGRSVGSNYLDSYLGNLTQHSWLKYAPSTPTQQSLYMPKRVYLYPDAFFRKENVTGQQLFMSRSFTEGISDPSFEYLGRSKQSFEEKRNLIKASPAVVSVCNVDGDRDTPSVGEMSGHGSRGRTEEVSVAPSSGTESGMGLEGVNCFSPSLGQSVCNSLPETTAVTSEAEQSFAVDSLETDIPCFSETSGVITHESGSEDAAGIALEVADEEVTISENFPDIPFETEGLHEVADVNTPSLKTSQVVGGSGTPALGTNNVNNKQLTENKVNFDIGGPVGYSEDHSAASNASDESSCCTQPSTIVILRENSPKMRDDSRASGPPALDETPAPQLLENVETNCGSIKPDKTTSVHINETYLLEGNNITAVDNNNYINNVKNMETSVEDTKDDLIHDSLNSSFESTVNMTLKPSYDRNDNTATGAILSELRSNINEIRGNPPSNANNRSVSFDLSGKSRTSTPETSVMSISSVSEAMGSSFIASDETNEEPDKRHSVAIDSPNKDIILPSSFSHVDGSKGNSQLNDSGIMKSSSELSCSTNDGNSLNTISANVCMTGLDKSGPAAPVSDATTAQTTSTVTVASATEKITPVNFPLTVSSCSATTSDADSLYVSAGCSGGSVAAGIVTTACSGQQSVSTTAIFPSNGSSTSNNTAPCSPGHFNNSVVITTGGGVSSLPSRVSTPMSSPHRHSTPTTPSTGLYSPVAGGPVLGKCSSRQHQINALLQLLRVQHHHEREQLIVRQQDEMQQFLQHLQKLTPAQLQHIVSTQVNSVQSSKLVVGGGKTGIPDAGDSKSPSSTSETQQFSSSQATTARDSSSPGDDSYNGNSMTASQSTPSLTENKTVNNHTNMMPSFYLHNPAIAACATTPLHLNKLFLQFPSKMSPPIAASAPSPHKASTPPSISKQPLSGIACEAHMLPSSLSSADLSRLKHFSRSQSEGTAAVDMSPQRDLSSPMQNRDGQICQNASKKSNKQSYNEKLNLYTNSRRSSSSSILIKEKMLNRSELQSSNPSSQLAPITPREDMAELSSSLTSSDLFSSLQSSLVSDSGLNGGGGRISRSVTVTKLTTETFLPQHKISRTTSRGCVSRTVVLGVCRLQATVRGRHVRHLLRCIVVQQHISTLQEVASLAARFHADLLADKITRGDVHFHRALYQQEQVARHELQRIFSLPFTEQVEMIQHDKLQRQLKLPGKTSPSGSGESRLLQQRRRPPPAPVQRRGGVGGGAGGNEGGSAGAGGHTKGGSNGRHIPTLKRQQQMTSSDGSVSCSNGRSNNMSSSSPKGSSNYSHVQSRYLSNLSKSPCKGKSPEYAARRKTGRCESSSFPRVSLPNVAASASLSCGSRPHNEKMCQQRVAALASSCDPQRGLGTAQGRRLMVTATEDRRGSRKVWR